MSARCVVSAIAASATLLGAWPASAYCPCYTASSPSNDHGCAIEAHDGENPTTEEWNDIFAVVSAGDRA